VPAAVGGPAIRMPVPRALDSRRAGCVPAAGGVNSNIKDLALWMIAQMGQMPDILSPRVLETIHTPLVKTPTENRRMRRFLERVSDPHYGYGWRTYDYAGNRVIGHHGGVAGYRALIMFDPVRKGGVVAVWNSNTSQPTGIEFEVMDMIYGLPFRDWLGLESKSGPAPATPDSEPMTDQGSDDVASAPAGVARSG
jgi:beta-lactamase class C